MALIIEDGSNVENADSFATVAECRAFATSRGLSLPTDDADVEILLRKATDYLNSIESKFQGYRYYYADGQALCFPRGDIYEFDKSIDGEIPKSLKDGQCQLAVDADSNDLLAPGSGREVIEKKIGPLTTKWNPTGNSAPQYSPTAALAILDPLLKPASSGMNLLSYR
jgi:hypothetical protein